MREGQYTSAAIIGTWLRRDFRSSDTLAVSMTAAWNLSNFSCQISRAYPGTLTNKEIGEIGSVPPRKPLLENGWTTTSCFKPPLVTTFRTSKPGNSTLATAWRLVTPTRLTGTATAAPQGLKRRLGTVLVGERVSCDRLPGYGAQPDTGTRSHPIRRPRPFSKHCAYYMIAGIG